MANPKTPRPKFPPEDFSSEEYTAKGLKTRISYIYTLIVAKLTTPKTVEGITFNGLKYRDDGLLPVNRFLYFLRFRITGNKIVVGMRTHDFYVVGHRVNLGKFWFAQQDAIQMEKCENCMKYYGIDWDVMPFGDDYPSMESASSTHKSWLEFGVGAFENVLMNLLAPTSTPQRSYSHLHFAVLFGEGARIEAVRRLVISIFGKDGEGGPADDVEITIPDETLCYIFSWSICSYVMQTNKGADILVLLDPHGVKIKRTRMPNLYHTAKQVNVYSAAFCNPLRREILKYYNDSKANFIFAMNLEQRQGQGMG